MPVQRRSQAGLLLLLGAVCLLDLARLRYDHRAVPKHVQLMVRCDSAVHTRMPQRAPDHALVTHARLARSVPCRPASRRQRKASLSTKQHFNLKGDMGLPHGQAYVVGPGKVPVPGAQYQMQVVGPLPTVPRVGPASCTNNMWHAYYLAIWASTGASSYSGLYCKVQSLHRSAPPNGARLRTVPSGFTTVAPTADKKSH